ncbi:MAG: serine/threonine-protein kinase [Woeseiaceae bacterium]
MNIKIMIIAEQADFRRLLAHHVTSHWPNAVLSEYDPTAAGHLPDEFSGAGNDLLLIGNRHGGDREGVDALRRFVGKEGSPPVVYFGSEDELDAIRQIAPDAYFMRDRFNHASLMVRLSDLLLARREGVSTDSLLVGDLRTGMHPLIKGYRFIRRLGSTEYSGVYLAERESENLLVVLKVLRQPTGQDANTDTFDRFLQEYETIAELHHPNIVRIYDLGVADDHAHIAMEYLDGGDLRHRMAAGIERNEAITYLRQIASGLAAVHEHGVLHRDLKPGNIMLRKDDSLALIDFGIAKSAKLESGITDKGEIFGTPYYMSPEQGHGNGADERSDIYSLGVVFYEMLTGEKPYLADTAMGIIYKHAMAPIPLLPLRFAEYQMLINLMLAKAPDDRLQKVDEIEEWL